MVLHTIGDSHAHNPWIKIPNVQVHHLGPKLCFSISRDGIDITHPAFNIMEGDTVVFSFGEIDCRCHVHRHISPTKSYTEVIDEIVDGYCTNLKKTVSMFNSLKTCVFNVIPPIQKPEFSLLKKPDIQHNPCFPFLGTDQERKMYVTYFNKKLEQNCAKHGFVFINVYDKYVDEFGFLNKSLKDSTIHIDNEIYLKEFIEENRL